MYAIIGFDFSGMFDQESYAFNFNGYEIELTKEVFEVRDESPVPSFISNQLKVKVENGDGEAEHEAGLMFLSELSWLYKVQILATEHITGGGGRCIAMLAGQRSMHAKVDMEYYKPMPLDDEQRLAVGLFKEGFSSTSVFFRLLGLYKILEIRMDTPTRREWVTNYLTEHWGGFGFDKPYEYIPKDPAELQLVLWQYGRCGVAHGGDEAIDVQSLYDRKKTGLCYDIIKMAVEHYMKVEMGIPKLLQY